MKTNFTRIGSLLAIVVLTTVSAHASEPAFDPETYTDLLAGAVTTAAPIVAALIALGAGIMVYKKVKRFFRQGS